MPEGPSGSVAGQKYDWESWLDGQVWKLTETVTLEAVLADDGETVLVPEQVVEGDFSVGVEKLRSYARNAAKRRKIKRSVRTRSVVEDIEVVRVPGEAPVTVQRRVLFVQGVDVSPTGGRAGRPRHSVEDGTAAVEVSTIGVPEDGEQLSLPVDDAAVAQVQAELDAVVEAEEPSEDDEPEWAEIPATEDPQDPFAPAVTEPWPATDPADEVDPVTEVAAGTGEVFTERPVAGEEILTGGDV